MQGPSSHFFPFLARGTKAADEPSLGAVALLLLLLPPQGCKAPHLYFALSPSGNKSKGRRAKPGCCSFFTPLNNEDKRQSAPLTETLYCTSTRRASSRYAGETGKRNLCFACVLPWFGLTDGALGAKEWKLGFAYTVRASYGPVLTSSDDSGVVVMVSRPSAVTRSYACLGQRVLV